MDFTVIIVALMISFGIPLRNKAIKEYILQVNDLCKKYGSVVALDQVPLSVREEDIQNGYIVNTGVSFSERAMPIVTGGDSVRGTRFYVNHDNSIDISITLKNLIDGTGHHYWEPITDVSFVFLGVYDSSGNVA